MIGSVHKTAKILTAVSEGRNEPVTLSEISSKTGINKSTCSHIISTLVADGFIKQISRTKGYVIGPEVYCLSRFGKYDDKLVSLCHPVIRWLYKKTGYTVILAVVEGGQKYTIDYVDAEAKIFPETAEIMPDDIYRTATGRIIMANMTDSEIRNIYQKNSTPPAGHWDGVDSLEKLEEKLSEIDKKGIVQTVSETSDGRLMLGYAAAIFRYRQCAGAIGVAVSCTPGEYMQIKEENIKINILKARNEIGRRLKYS